MGPLDPGVLSKYSVVQAVLKIYILYNTVYIYIILNQCASMQKRIEAEGSLSSQKMSQELEW